MKPETRTLQWCGRSFEPLSRLNGQDMNANALYMIFKHFPCRSIPHDRTNSWHKALTSK